MLRAQGALTLTAFGLFIAGRVTGSDTVSLAGFVIYVVLNVVELVGGLLTPAGLMVTVVIGLVGSVLFSPWWLGLGWFFWVTGIFGVPRSIQQIVDPVGMWKRFVYPRLSLQDKVDRMGDGFD